jgi:acetylornithine/N-succinyldiaminopimelate aminotransferase
MMGLRTVVPNAEFIAAARGQKVILIGAGDNVVRLLPPLIIGDTDITEAFNRLDAACATVETELKTAAQPGVAQ